MSALVDKRQLAGRVLGAWNFLHLGSISFMSLCNMHYFDDGSRLGADALVGELDQLPNLPVAGTLTSLRKM
jgi:hypothetical protein